MEAFVPDLSGFDNDQRSPGRPVATRPAPGSPPPCSTGPPSASAPGTSLSASAGIETYPIELRFAWPSELDLMARLAGLSLTGRWGGWQGQPFTSSSDSHVSVWQTPERP